MMMTTTTTMMIIIIIVIVMVLWSTALAEQRPFYFTDATTFF